MDFFYFLVTSSKAWEPRFHENFFNSQGGFLWGFIGALVLGVICACAFYFGCCNNKKSAKSASIGVWAVTLVICGILGYFYADLVIIGDSATTDNGSIFRRHSFYKANDDYFIKETGKAGVSDTVIKQLTQTKNEIKTNLDRGGDVRFDYAITTAVLALLFYFLTSIIIKRFTVNGKTIPFLKP